MALKYFDITVWNRLEGRPRNKEFGQNLAAEVRDPLWMLTRQWQVGEFEAEDNGSPVFACMDWKARPMQNVSLAGNDPLGISVRRPLEAEVEKVQAPLDVYLRLEMGRHFQRLLQRSLTPAKAQMVKQKLADVSALRFQLPAAGSPEERYQNAQLLQNRELMQVLHNARRTKALDGGELYQYLKNNNTHKASDFLDGADTQVDALGREFVEWFDGRYTQPADDRQDAWLPERLEYQFDTAVSNGEGNAASVYGASEYFQGRLDWYAFDKRQTQAPKADALADGLDHSSEQAGRRNVIPAEVEFSGMPHARWWEFEDTRLNLSALEAQIHESGKAILAEFGLLYSNDWFVMPLRVPIGSAIDLATITVTDVFGQRVLVHHYDEGANRTPHWSLFSIHDATQSDITQQHNRELLLPPVVFDMQSGKSLEEAFFFRDEMANMVWAIEATVPDGLGLGRDGYAYSDAIRAYFDALGKELNPDPIPDLKENEAPIKYLLATTTVPENWIPFVPAQIPGSVKDIQFQRAAMPRIVSGFSPRRIRPLTTLLRQGLEEVTKLPYYIFEEEIPRSGARVELRWQRTRWYNGEVVLWLGYRKTNGRGEGASGLEFDQIR